MVGMDFKMLNMDYAWIEHVRPKPNPTRLPLSLSEWSKTNLHKLLANKLKIINNLRLI